MARAHYHVFTGTVGCLQDGDATFATKRDALAYARAEARDYRDAGVKVSGNAEDGYAIDPINTLTVESCSDPTCELWAEYLAAVA